MKLKVGDNVRVIAGKDKGTDSRIARVIKKRNQVIVEGVATAKRHQRPQARRCRAASSTRTCRSMQAT